MKILILGSTSHIAKGLIYYFKMNKDVELECRDRSNLAYFINYYDMIINCIGYSSPEKLKMMTFEDIETYNSIDNNIILNLQIKKDTLGINPIYINLSSWIVNEDIKEGHPKYRYWVYKKYLEMKHRMLPKLNIIDLRIPAYFSRWIDLDSGFLMSDILKSIKNKTEFKLTDEIDDYFWYITPKILLDIIITRIKENSAIDLYKYINPIYKSTILDYFHISHNFENILQDPFYIRRYDSFEGIKFEYQEWLKLNPDISK